MTHNNIKGFEMTSDDSEYKATALIKEGKVMLDSALAELADWIASKWQVTVLNVIYDQLEVIKKRPRLQVIFEHTRECREFLDGYNFDHLKQQVIATRFTEMVNRQGLSQYKVDDLLVVFAAFAPVAREEADTQITEEELYNLQRRIANSDLWTIHRCFGHVTFMFYKNRQARKYARKGYREVYAGVYFDLLKLHDRFNYLNRSRFSVDFDSKENLDKKYEGSWFYYDR